MAGSRKEYDLIFKIAAETAGSFKQSFSGASKELTSLQSATKSLNTTLKKIDGIGAANKSIESNSAKLKLLAEEHKKIQSEISATKNKSKELSNELKRNEAAISKLEPNESNRNEIAKLEKEHDKLQKAISKTEKTSESLNSKLSRNEEQMEQTSAKIQQEENKLKSLNAELKNAGVNTEDLSGETARLGMQYDKLKASQDRINSLNQALNKNAAYIQNTKAAIGKTAMVAGIATAGIYKGAIEPAAEFESQMSTVGAISNASAEDLALLTANAKELGRTTAFSAVEAGQGMEYAAMAGWKTNQIIEGMPGIMNLAAASGEDLASVSDIVTDALSAMKMQVSESTHFADVLAAASSNANVNVGMLGESFKYCAPLAGAYGFNIEDTALMLSIMGNNGIKASNSGTAFRKVLTALSSDLKIAQADGQKFIVSTTNADGSMRSLRDIIDDVRIAFNGMSEEEKKAEQNNLTQMAEDLAISLKDENGKLKTQAELYEEVITAADGLTEAGKVQEAEAIAGKTAMAGLLAIINTSEEDYNKLTEAIYNCDGAAEQMAQKRLDNLKGDLTLAKSATEGFQIALGNALIPKLREVVQGITPVISNLAAWVEENPELVAGIVKIGASLIALKGGFLISKLGFLEVHKYVLLGQKAFNVYKSALAAASITQGQAVTTTTLLKSGLSALVSPVGLATVAVGGLFLGIAAYIKKTEEARQESIHFAEDLVTAKESFDEVNKKANETQSLIDKYRELSEIVKTTAENTEENKQAKEELKEVEQLLIEQNPKVLGKYEEENGKIEENLDLLEKQIDRERELARIKLEQESYDAKKELSNNIETIKDLTAESKKLDQQYDNYVTLRTGLTDIVGKVEQYEALYKKGSISESSYNKIISNYATQATALADKYSETKYAPTDALGIKNLLNTIESETSKTVDKINTNNEELTTARTNLESYKDTQKQLIELNLGSTLEEATTNYKSMSNELEKLSKNGQGSSERAQELKGSMTELEQKFVIVKTKLQDYYDAEKQTIELDLGSTLEEATANYKSMSDELDRLNKNGQGGSERAQELKEKMTELKPKIDSATQGIDNLNKAFEGIPGVCQTEIKADGSQAINEANNVHRTYIDKLPKDWMLTMGANVSSSFTNAVNTVRTTIGQIPTSIDTIFSVTVKGLRGFATGGIIEKPTIAKFAEEGPEAAIPLDGSSRAKSLWLEAGRRLGMDTEPIYSELPEIKSTSTGDNSNTNKWTLNVTYNVYGGNNEDLSAQFEANNRRIMEMIQEKEDRARRLNYA